MQPPRPNDGVEMGLCPSRGLGVGLHKDEGMACLCTALFDRRNLLCLMVYLM
jgi:hypothetical protein